MPPFYYVWDATPLPISPQMKKLPLNQWTECYLWNLAELKKPMKIFSRKAPTNPANPVEIQKRNFQTFRIDAIGIAWPSAAAPFLPVFMARLGASNFQVGLLTSMPAFTGLFLAIIVGSFFTKTAQDLALVSALRGF